MQKPKFRPVRDFGKTKRDEQKYMKELKEELERSKMAVVNVT